MVEGLSDIADERRFSEEIFLVGVGNIGDLGQDAGHARKPQDIKGRGLDAMVGDHIWPIHLGDHGFFRVPRKLALHKFCNTLMTCHIVKRDYI